jgi:hypothetical protein
MFSDIFNAMRSCMDIRHCADGLLAGIDRWARDERSFGQFGTRALVLRRAE